MNTKNKQRARLALAELEKEMEVLSKEEMKTCKGGETYIRRDPSGNIIFTPIDSGYQWHKDDDDSYRGSFMVKGYIYADDGTKVVAYRNICCDAGFNTDCHGVTFADGKYWINNDQVNKILEGDFYKEVNEHSTGGVVVFYDSSGNVIHSATLAGYNTTYGLGGLETTTYNSTIQSDMIKYRASSYKIFKK